MVLPGTLEVGQALGLATVLVQFLGGDVTDDVRGHDLAPLIVWAADDDGDPDGRVLLLPTAAVAANVGFLRVIRVLRFYRFTREREFFFGTVSLGTLRAMKLLLTVLTIFFVAAGLFYTAERGVNPEVRTFGDAFYFMMVALTTVGFGDIVPVTGAGRLVTTAATLAGIVLIPGQASRIVRQWTTPVRTEVTCPECGLTGHEPDASHCRACGAVIYQEYEGGE